MLNNKISTAPAPFKHWLIQINKSTIALILEKSSQHINKQWQKTVYPVYLKNIKGRFPVIQSAKRDITIQSFTHFFGPKGLVENFFNTLVAPFIDTIQTPWALKKIKGRSLNISDDLIKSLHQASMIQRIFYQENNKIPTLAFSIKESKKINDTSLSILNIGGTIINNKDMKPINITFPGELTKFVTFGFPRLKGGKNNITTTGPWAWLRLLKDPSLTKEELPNNQWLLSFNLKSEAAHYLLSTKFNINPYHSGILDYFKLKKSALQKSDTSNSQD